MKERKVIIFYGFPKSSILKDELITNIPHRDNISYVSCDSILQVINQYTNVNDSLLVAHCPEEEKVRNLKKLVDKIHLTIDKIPNIILISEAQTEGEVTALESRYGVVGFCNTEDHPVDISDTIEQFIVKNFIAQNENYTLKESKSSEEDFNYTVNSKSDEFDRMVSVASKVAEKQNINLDSGELKVKMHSGLLEGANCKLESFSENSLELEIDRTNTEEITDQPLEVDIVFIYNRCKVELTLIGQVKEAEKTGENSSVLVINLDNNESVSLNNFMTLFQERQKSIDDFLKLAKGT